MSCWEISKAESANIIPVTPPEINAETAPIQNNMAGVIITLPFQIVVIKLNAFTAEGIAINKVVNVKTPPRNGFIPVKNMWCPQTIKDRNPIANIDPIIAL